MGGKHERVNAPVDLPSRPATLALAHILVRNVRTSARTFA